MKLLVRVGREFGWRKREVWFRVLGWVGLENWGHGLGRVWVGEVGVGEFTRLVEVVGKGLELVWKVGLRF